MGSVGSNPTLTAIKELNSLIILNLTSSILLSICPTTEAIREKHVP